VVTEIEILLQAHHVRFAVHHTPILTGVDFQLRAGEFVGLIGANGAGKSTLLKVMGGLWKASGGQIDLVGKPLSQYQTREIARLIAYVAQAAHVDFAFTTREMVLMGRSPHLNRFEMETARDRQIADAAMQTTDITHLADRLAFTLSGGEQQRMFIARALTQEPRLLLLDEPTSNLDIRHQIDVLTLARSLAHERGLGVIAAIHHLELAARFCDRLALMTCGGIVADGKPEQVLTPEYLSQAFQIQAQVYRDPYTQQLALSVSSEKEI
jgi:iron complex transport system ATP-binding protein